MMAPAAPPTTPPMMAPAAVLPVALPITAPITAPPPAPTAAPVWALVAHPYDPTTRAAVTPIVSMRRILCSFALGEQAAPAQPRGPAHPYKVLARPARREAVATPWPSRPAAPIVLAAGAGRRRRETRDDRASQTQDPASEGVAEPRCPVDGVLRRGARRGRHGVVA